MSKILDFADISASPERGLSRAMGDEAIISNLVSSVQHDLFFFQRTSAGSRVLCGPEDEEFLGTHNGIDVWMDE